jgi:hypothetical protein
VIFGLRQIGGRAAELALLVAAAAAAVAAVAALGLAAALRCRRLLFCYFGALLLAIVACLTAALYLASGSAAAVDRDLTLRVATDWPAVLEAAGANSPELAGCGAATPSVGCVVGARRALQRRYGRMLWAAVAQAGWVAAAALFCTKRALGGPVLVVRMELCLGHLTLLAGALAAGAGAALAGGMATATGAQLCVGLQLLGATLALLSAWGYCNLCLPRCARGRCDGCVARCVELSRLVTVAGLALLLVLLLVLSAACIFKQDAVVAKVEQQLAALSPGEALELAAEWRRASGCPDLPPAAAGAGTDASWAGEPLSELLDEAPGDGGTSTKVKFTGLTQPLGQLRQL